MGDGKAYNKAFMFCTDSFTKQDQENLCQMLRDLYGFSCEVITIKPENRIRIVIRAESMREFVNLVAPHFDPSMYYKLGDWINDKGQS
jgi:hypothetical protein